MTAIQELGSLLRSLEALKPPGVTKTKIDSITNLCIQNISTGPALIQKICSHFKKTPNTHKLGVLYVVDSVTRKWGEQARLAGQPLSGVSAPNGSFTVGVRRMTEVLPELMNELIVTAPENQKEKITKLLEIWEKGNTFPQSMLAGFRKHLAAPQQKTLPPARSYTPPGDPSSDPSSFPQYIYPGSGTQAQKSGQALARPPLSVNTAPPVSDAAAILAALANMGQQSASLPTSTNTQATNPGAAVSSNVQFSPANGAAATHQATASSLLSLPGSAPASSANPFSSIPPVPSSNPFPPGPPPANIMLQYFLLAQAQNMTQDQINGLIANLTQQSAATPLVPAAAQAAPATPADDSQSTGFAANGKDGREHEYQRRDRSHSPDHKRRRVSPPNRRASPTYGEYDPAAAQAETPVSRPPASERRGRGRGRYRHDKARSPGPKPLDRPATPETVARSLQQKLIDHDATLPRGVIKVLSRTLFVGGASCTEDELKAIFSQFGKVQSCIVNQDKRHAFVKMINREDAVKAMRGMEDARDPNISSKARETRWGVGFGPRDCSDYSVGISTIPIDRLTEADRKWVVNAEYGGTGGRPLETGMVIEEPDIEIGAGVSSKAISRRVGPDPGRRAGHFGGHRGDSNQSGQRFRKDREGLSSHKGGSLKDGSRGGAQSHKGGSHKGGSSSHKPGPPVRPPSPRPEPHAVVAPPAVPTFGFKLPGM